jgi:hypothetical protein
MCTQARRPWDFGPWYGCWFATAKPFKITKKQVYLSPRGFRRLRFSLAISALVSCSSTQKPASGSRPLYAGRRLPSHQAPDRLIPVEIHAPGFDDACFLTTRHRRVCFRSSPGRIPVRDHAPSFPPTLASCRQSKQSSLNLRLGASSLGTRLLGTSGSQRTNISPSIARSSLHRPRRLFAKIRNYERSTNANGANAGEIADDFGSANHNEPNTAPLAEYELSAAGISDRSGS